MMRALGVGVALLWYAAFPALAQDNAPPAVAPAVEQSVPPAASPAPNAQITAETVLPIPDVTGQVVTGEAEGQAGTEAVVSPPPTPATPAKKAAAAVDEEEQKGLELLKQADYPSLFYSEEEMNRIYQAIENYIAYKQRAGDEEDFVSALQKKIASARPTPQQPPPLEHRKYYLSSIVYYSPTHWTVWINGAKLTAKEPKNGELSVTHISKQRAGLSWKPVSFEAFSKQMPEKPGKDVTVDKEGKLVHFILNQNQYFSTRQLAVFEGKPPPDAPPAQPGKEGAAPIAAPQTKPSDPVVATKSTLPAVPTVGLKSASPNEANSAIPSPLAVPPAPATTQNRP